MRSRETILADSRRKEDLIIEVLLDIRDAVSGIPMGNDISKGTEASLPIVERKKRKKKRKYTKRKVENSFS